MYFDVREDTHFLRLQFHAPASSNALSLEAARELAAITRQYRSWSKPVVVRSSHKTMFCSGGNLTDYQKLRGKAPGLKINREIEHSLDTFAAWPVVKLAMVEGDVLGGGMEWLARFDFRWSNPHCLFSFWQRRIGLSTGWGGGSVWAAKLGEARVRTLLLEGQLLSAERAMSIGLMDRMVSAPRVDTEIQEWTERIHSEINRPLLQWAAKRETQTFAELWLGKVHQAALARWKPKQK